MHAVIWIGTFGAHIPHDLGTLGGSFVSSSATSVSEPDTNGHVWIVGDSRTEPTPREPMIRRSVLWQVDSQGSVLSTTDLDPTGSSVWARDVKVIGNSVFIAGATGDQAVIWEADLSGNVVGSQELVSLAERNSCDLAAGALYEKNASLSSEVSANSRRKENKDAS